VKKVQFALFTRPHLTLPALLWFGFAIRLYQLGTQSLWYDETVSAFLAKQTEPELIAHTARDIHPPAYYLLLHYWAGLTGHSEFALAFLSLSLSLLLIPLTYRLARYLVNRPAAIWTATLITFSPFHLWYAQEVRMYTLAATLGVLTAYFGLRALADSRSPSQPGASLEWVGYWICAAAGLYTLYYFAFLLMTLNLIFLLYTLRPRLKQRLLVTLLTVNAFVMLAYLPWLPIAWRQATNPPVPPWRNFNGLDLGPILLESWTALSLGQSVTPATVWPVLLLSLGLAAAGWLYLRQAPLLPDEAPLPPLSGAFFLVAYTFGPLLLIYLASFITPLYHLRYIFTYSPAFYILLGAGLVWLARRFTLKAAGIVAVVLLLASLYSIYQLQHNPRYQPDDFRAAVNFIEARWQPGDVILVNAGYVYTAFDYYNRLPQLERRRLAPYRRPTDLDHPLLLQTGTINGRPELGWGDPQADFYPMSEAQTAAALAQLTRDFARLWLLRAYDTVTDPNSFIRDWLAQNTIRLEDEPFAGESNIRVQGFLLSPPTPDVAEIIEFEDGLALAGWELPNHIWQPSQTIHLKLWWLATAPPGVDYKMSLKLWTPTGELAAQGRDEWPVGTLYRATAWRVGQAVYHPVQLNLPANLPPGQYWLNVELYHPDTLLPLARLDGHDPVVTLGAVNIQ
jgi:mannosyltransferase